MTDREILDIVMEMKSGNNLNFEKLINYFKPYIYTISKKYFLKGGDKDDVTQNGYIGLWRGIKYFDIEKVSNINAFLRMCIKREIYKSIRLADRKKHNFLNSSISFENVMFENDSDKNVKLIDAIRSGDDSIEDIVISKFEAHNLERCILSEIRLLTNLERRCMDLYMKGLKLSEISRCLHLNNRQVDNALERSKKKLKKKYRTTEGFKIAKKFY